MVAIGICMPAACVTAHISMAHGGGLHERRLAARHAPVNDFNRRGRPPHHRHRAPLGRQGKLLHLP
jgi:hypothetical protein